MPNLKKIFFTATKTGIRQSLQAWLETIADKEFGLEYSLMDAAQQFQVKMKFVERKKNGIFVEG